MNPTKIMKWRFLSKRPISSQIGFRTFRSVSEHRTKQDSGYTIMAPDLPSDTAENNHVLYIPKEEETSKYSLISPMKCLRAFVKNVILFEAELDEIEEFVEQDTGMKKTFDEVYSKLEERLIYMDYSFAVLRCLQMNNFTKYKFKDEDIGYMSRRLNIVASKRFSSGALSKYMREFNSDKLKLNKYQQRIVERYVTEGPLNGCLLTTSEKDKFKSQQKELDKQMIKFKSNVMTATARFKHVVSDQALLKYFPEDFLLSQGSREKLTVKLEPSTYEPFMEYCPDSMERWNVWRGYNIRCSHSVDMKISNSVVIEDIRQLRRDIAQTLGFENYVDLSMATKMAQSSDTVYSMIDSLREKTEKIVKEEIKELTDFANKSEIIQNDTLEPWNIPYLKRQYLKENYIADMNSVKQYFPLPAVLRGLFGFTRRIFDIHVEEVQQKNFDAWNEDVRLFRLISPKGLLGSFYFDAFIRTGDKKVTKPRVDFITSRHEALKIKPLCHLVTNFQRPLSEKYPPLLTFDDVLLLFKSFGYVLQHIVNEMPLHELSGMNNLEWDRIHLCSEFMGLWFLHDYDVAQSCSENITEGTPVPKQLFDTIKNMKLKFYSFHLREELYKAALDFALHSSDAFWKDVMLETWNRYLAPFKLDSDNHHVCSFTDIFCGPSAGYYYNRKWSEMLAADAFLAFKEVEDYEEDFNKTGKRFLDTILSLGGGCNGKETFRLFRGRDPSSDALLFVNNIFEQKLFKEKDEYVHK